MTPEPGWQTLAGQSLCATPHLSVCREHVASPLHPSGREWITVVRKPAVVIVPMTPDGRFLMIRQERIPARRTFWEFPAGQVDEGDGLDALMETARRELWEETGHEAPHGLTKLSSFYSSPGFTSEMQTVFLAREVRPSENPPPNPALEAIHGLDFFTAGEIFARISDGVLCDANSLAAWAMMIAGGFAVRP